MDLDPRTIQALWELREHIDDPYVLGDLTGWLECQEGTPPYSTLPDSRTLNGQGLRYMTARAWLDSLPPPKPGSHESQADPSHWSHTNGVPFLLPGETDCLEGRGGTHEWERAANWSRANREAT